MTTFHRPIYFGLDPDTSGSVWWEPRSVLLTNDKYNRQWLVFADTATKLWASGSFRVPDNYVGSPNFVVRWATAATSGNLIVDGEYRAIADGESADPTTNQEAVTSGAVAAPGTTWLEKETVIALTGANFAAGDLVEYDVGRDGSDSDTIAASVVFCDVLFRYADA